MDSDPEAMFDRITSVAARLLRAPLAQVNLVDAQRQFSKSSFAPEGWPTDRNTPMPDSFCKLAVMTDNSVRIPDTATDARVADTRTARELGLRAYLGVPLRDLGGHVLGALCVADFEPRQWQDEHVQLLTDLAEIVMTEMDLRANVAAVQRSEAAYRVLLDAAADAVLILDPRGTVLESNQRAHELLGYSRAEMLKLDALTLLSTEVFEPPHREVLVAGKTTRLERVFERPDGSRAPIEIAARKLPDERLLVVLRALPQATPAPPDLRFGIAHDSRDTNIEQQPVDEDAELQRDFMAAVLENMAEGVVACDAAGNLTLFNRATREFHQRPELPLPQEQWAAHYNLYRPDGQLMATEEVPLVRALRGEIVRDLEMVIAHPGREPIHVLASGRAIHDRQGRKLGAVVTTHDITERKQAEDRALQLMREQIARSVAEQASRSKTQFLTAMSHELRTPLNAIMGFAQLLEADPDLEDAEAVQQILSAGRHLLDVVDEVLDIARVEGGHLLLNLRPVPVAEVVGELFDLLRPLADQRSVTLTLDEPISPAWYVRADLKRFKQILINVLSNAIKFNRPGGRVAVGCRIKAEGRLGISVSDTGAGLTPEKLLRLFQPFERLGAEAQDIEGTGLGLSLSKALSEVMNGQLTVSSVPGVGSSFTLELPREDGAAGRVEPAAAATSPHADIANGEHTILYIEDHSANVRLLERIFARRKNTRMLSANHGRVGLELALQHQPDLILTDRHLPDISGDEIIEHIRREPALAATPVVMISGDAIPENVATSLTQGADAYVTKPFDIASFLSIVDRLLFERRRRA